MVGACRAACSFVRDRGGLQPAWRRLGAQPRSGAAPMSAPRLVIEALSAISLRAGGAPILRRVSLTVDTGEVHGLVGESGAGKSTIAKAILGIVPSQVKITAGRIDFEGANLLRLAPNDLRDVLGRDIALIPQDPLTALNPARRIEAQMTDGLRLRRSLSRADA